MSLLVLIYYQLQYNYEFLPQLISPIKSSNLFTNLWDYIIIGYNIRLSMDVDDGNGKSKNLKDKKDKFISAKLIKNMINPVTGEVEYQYCEGAQISSAVKYGGSNKKEEQKNEQKKQDINNREEQKKKEGEIEKNEEEIKKKQSKFIFQGSSQSSQGKETHKQVIKQNIQKKEIKKNNLIFDDQEESDEDEYQEQTKIALFAENQEVNDQKSDHQNDDRQSQSLQGREQTIQKRYLTPQMRLTDKMFVRMQLWRKKNFFQSTFYHVTLQSNQRLIVAAKQTSSGFILSRSPDAFEENGPFYIGKAKFNFSNTHMDFFLTGLNPSDARERNVKPRELVMSLQTVSQALMEEARPREFEAYLLKEGFSYHRDLEGYVKGEQIALSDLYKNYDRNKDKIDYYRTRKSKWNEEERIHYLNMKGRAKLASVKNFIMESPAEQGNDILLLGKIGDNVYNLDIHCPLNTIQGTAVALSSFLYKTW